MNQKQIVEIVDARSAEICTITCSTGMDNTIPFAGVVVSKAEYGMSLIGKRKRKNRRK